MSDRELQSLLNSLLRETGEKTWLEFKENNFKPEEIGEYISCLANSTNLAQKKFGYLVFGVQDQTKKVVGTKFKPSLEKVGNELLEHWLFQRLSPKIDFQIYEFEYSGEPVVIFCIPAAIDRPIEFSYVAWIRVGSVKRKLQDAPEKARKIWQNLQKRSFEREIARENVTLDEALKLLDYDKYFELTNKPLPSNKLGFIAVMQQDGLLTNNANYPENYDITNLGAVLFARDLKKFQTTKRKPPRIIIYDGKDRSKRVKEQEGAKGYAAGFEGLIAYVDGQLPVSEKIKSALREESRIYPNIILREIIANALIHQDFYARGSGPMIEIFKDRIEITNPGIPLISVDRFIDHPPQSRNEDLAAFMRRLHICEEGGSGIDKTIIAVEKHHLPPPKFESGENYTRVVIFAPRARQMSREEKVRACFQHCVLRWVSNDFMTNSSLRVRFDLEKKKISTVSKIITDTVKVNLIKRQDPLQQKHAKYVPFWA